MVGRLRPAIVGVVTALALLGTGTATAASPQRIYSDLADNGRLDGKYTPAEIRRALELPQILRSDARESRSGHAEPVTQEPAARADRQGSNLPFSGLDLALLTVGGGPLLLLGVALRRRFSTARAAPVASG